MKKLKDRGYLYPTRLELNREDYRVRAAYMLENNNLLPERAQPTTVETLEELYREEFGLDVKYIEGLISRHAYGATASLGGIGPQIYLDKSLLCMCEYPEKRLHVSTLAHELGHAFLHCEEIRYRVAALTDKISAFMIKQQPQKSDWLTYLRSRKKKSYDHFEFIEFQANQIMVGLLMPFSTLYKQTAEIIKMKLDYLKIEYGWDYAYALKAREHEIFDYAVKQLSNCYYVSEQMAAFELYRMFEDKKLSMIFRGVVPADPIQKVQLQR